VKISIEIINPAGGNTEQLDVDIASGNIPDLYFDNQMRIAKYDGLGLLADLRDYVPQEVFDDYVEGTFADGQPVWRLPIDMSAQFIAVNKTMFEQIGAADLLPASREWTTDEFLAALDAVKAAGLSGVFPTILWAADPSGDVCNMGYLWGFGARMFATGDYSKTLLNSPEGVAAFEFLNNLATNYAVPGAAALNDDDMLAMYPAQQVALTGGYAYLEKAGNEADPAFETYFVNFPHPAGEENPPFAVHMHGVAVFKSEDEARMKAAAEFAQFIAGEDWAPLLCEAAGTAPSRVSFVGQVTRSAENQAIDAMIATNGLVDFGATSPKFQEIRNVYIPQLQAMFTGEKTPEQAVADAAAGIDAILADV
jgi:multiple sugar transport system substrate-binding protein